MANKFVKYKDLITIKEYDEKTNKEEFVLLPLEDDLVVGNYEAIEVSSSNSLYPATSLTRAISLKGNSATIQVKITNLRQSGNLEIHKVDKDNHNIKLPNVKFTLRATSGSMNGKYVSVNSSGKAVYNNSRVTVQTNGSGDLYISELVTGSYELKLYSNNKVVINTCEFHVKQKINRSTTDKDLRITIANIIYEKEDKEEFIKEMDKLIESKTTDARKEKITEYKNYILRHWKGIINMKNSLCKSSMEAHIEHCIASSFSSVPKAYSENNIETYLKLQEIILNGISIFDYYLGTYNSDDNYIYNNEKEVNYSMFEHSTSNLPGLYSNHSLSKALHSVIDY